MLSANSALSTPTKLGPAKLVATTSISVANMALKCKLCSKKWLNTTFAPSARFTAPY